MTRFQAEKDTEISTLLTADEICERFAPPPLDSGRTFSELLSKQNAEDETESGSKCEVTKSLAASAWSPRRPRWTDLYSGDDQERPWEDVGKERGLASPQQCSPQTCRSPQLWSQIHADRKTHPRHWIPLQLQVPEHSNRLALSPGRLRFAGGAGGGLLCSHDYPEQE